MVEYLQKELVVTFSVVWGEPDLNLLLHLPRQQRPKAWITAMCYKCLRKQVPTLLLHLIDTKRCFMTIDLMAGATQAVALNQFIFLVSYDFWAEKNFNFIVELFQ